MFLAYVENKKSPRGDLRFFTWVSVTRCKSLLVETGKSKEFIASLQNSCTFAVLIIIETR